MPCLTIVVVFSIETRMLAKVSPVELLASSATASAAVDGRESPAWNTRKKLKAKPTSSTEYQRSSLRNVMETVVNMVMKVDILGWRPSNRSSSAHANRMDKAEKWRHGPGSCQ